MSEICEKLSMLSGSCCIKHVRMRSHRVAFSYIEHQPKSMFVLDFAIGMHLPAFGTLFSLRFSLSIYCAVSWWMYFRNVFSSYHIPCFIGGVCFYFISVYFLSRINSFFLLCVASFSHSHRYHVPLRNSCQERTRRHERDRLAERKNQQTSSEYIWINDFLWIFHEQK